MMVRVITLRLQREALTGRRLPLGLCNFSSKVPRTHDLDRGLYSPGTPGENREHRRIHEPGYGCDKICVEDFQVNPSGGVLNLRKITGSSQIIGEKTRARDFRLV
jgi:hypothetical protein